MSDTTWTIYTDGGARGNPGPAAYAYVIKRPDEADIEEKCFLGRTTNNIAEYTGLVKALEHAKELGGRKLMIYSDSELMVKQMSGQYRVKNEGLQPLYQQAVQLRKQFDSVIIKHVRRELNQQADALCNEALDNPHEAKPRVPSTPTADAKPVADTPEPSAILLSPLLQALGILRENAKRWANSGDPTNPPPAEVLTQIWEVLKHADE
jgi:ribonuclease HI